MIPGLIHIMIGEMLELIDDIKQMIPDQKYLDIMNALSAAQASDKEKDDKIKYLQGEVKDVVYKAAEVIDDYEKRLADWW